MKKSDTFADRRQEAEAARIRRVERFKERPAQDNPDAVERAAARQAQRAAQAEVRAASALDKAARAQALRAEAEAADEARRAAEDQQLRTDAQARETQSLLDEASRKAKRDARYASRKARS